MSPIVKRVEVNGHLIVAADLFAWCQMTSDFFWLIFADKQRVQIFTVVGEVRERALADGTAIGRFTLTEACHACSLRERPSSRELPHVGPPCDPGNSDGRQTQRIRVDARRPGCRRCGLHRNGWRRRHRRWWRYGASGGFAGHRFDVDHELARGLRAIDVVGSRGGKIESDARGTGETSDKNPDERRVLAQDLSVRQHRAYCGPEDVDGDPGRPLGPRRFVADLPLNDEHDANGVARRQHSHRFELRASASHRRPVCRRPSCVCGRDDEHTDGRDDASDMLNAFHGVRSGGFRAPVRTRALMRSHKIPMLPVPHRNRRAASRAARGRFICAMTNVSGVLCGSETATYRLRVVGEAPYRF